MLRTYVIYEKQILILSTHQRPTGWISEEAIHERMSSCVPIDKKVDISRFRTCAGPEKQISTLLTTELTPLEMDARGTIMGEPWRHENRIVNRFDILILSCDHAAEAS
jgi:hypothetical protein